MQSRCWYELLGSLVTAESTLGRYKTWTLDSVLDYGLAGIWTGLWNGIWTSWNMEWNMDWSMDWNMDWNMD